MVAPGGVAAVVAGASLTSPSRSPSRSTGGAAALPTAEVMAVAAGAASAVTTAPARLSISDPNVKFNVTEPSVQARTFNLTSLAISLAKCTASAWADVLKVLAPCRDPSKTG